MYLNTNLRLNGSGESSVRGLKNFFKFSLNELKEQGHCDPRETEEDNRTSAL